MLHSHPQRIADGDAEHIAYGVSDGDSQRHAEHKPDGIGYSVHRHPETGRQACVLVNFLEEELTVSLSFTDSGSGSAQLQIPFAPLERISLPGEVSIPGRRFALVVED